MMHKRNTPQKKAVLETLAEMKNHPTANMVFGEVQRKHPKISRSTVFRVLANAAEDGDVLRLQITDSDDRFDHQCHDHYHIRCRKCGRVDDVIMEYMGDILNNVQDSAGYDIEGHTVEFVGLCGNCLK